MLKLDEPFPSRQSQSQPQSQGQAGTDNLPSPAAAMNQSAHQPRDYHYYHQLGGAGAELQPHQGFTKTHVPPPVIPVGLIAPGLVEWQRETKECLEKEWPRPTSTGGITPMLRRGVIIPGSRSGENTGGGTVSKFGGAPEVARGSVGSEAVAVIQQQQGVDTAVALAAAAAAASAAAGQTSDRNHQQQQGQQRQTQYERYQQQQQQLQQQQQYQQRAARTGRSSDLRK